MPIKEVSICSIVVFGTRYIRKEPLPEIVDVQTSNPSVLIVPHVYAENFIADKLVINLRQKAGSELRFVTLINGATSNEVVIDATDVLPG